MLKITLPSIETRALILKNLGKLHRAIKSQVLANFLAKWTEAELPKEYSAYSHWTMYFDGSKTLPGLGARVILTSPTSDNVRYVLQIMYADSNNATE